MKYDIITFGSATLDVFVKTKHFLIKPEKKFPAQKAVCFPFSSKVDVRGMDFFSGGGGANTAVALSLQGFKTAYCGKVGNDFAGQEILNELKSAGVQTNFISKSDKIPTNLSIIFSWGRDRTCFVWRGASELLLRRDIPLKGLKADWFYLAPLSGQLSNLFSPLIDFGNKNHIKIFANPGNSQIKLGIKKLKPILQKIDILLLNQEEASLLTGIDYQKEAEIFRKMNDLMSGIVIMTKGESGAVVSDGDYVWEAGILPVSVAEKTGAGDAFGSGFLAGILGGKDIEYALRLGIANATACIQKVGAKQGLLEKGKRWQKVKIRKKKLSKT